MGVRVGQGAGIGRDAGQDSLAQPAQAGRQGCGGDSHGTQTVITRRPGRAGQGFVMTRCREGGARTVMPRRAGRRGERSAMTRRLWVPGAGPGVVRRRRHGTQTVLTRRPGRGGQGYVSTRCPKGGARTVMPRRTQRGEGSAMTRRPRHGTQTVLTRRPRRTGEGYVSTRCPCGGTQTAMPRRALGGGRSAMTRCPRLGGYATTGGRHAGAGASLPGGARCSRMDLHLPIPVRRAYRRGVGERQRPGGRVGRASPADGPKPHGQCQVWCGFGPSPGPLSTM